MAAAGKQKRFQWNKCDKGENLIRCLSNFKAQKEYENIDFTADEVKQYDAVKKAMNSARVKIYPVLFLCKYVFLAERYAAKDRFRFSSIIL